MCRTKCYKESNSMCLNNLLVFIKIINTNLQLNTFLYYNYVMKFYWHIPVKAERWNHSKNASANS